MLGPPASNHLGYFEVVAWHLPTGVPAPELEEAGVGGGPEHLACNTDVFTACHHNVCHFREAPLRQSPWRVLPQPRLPQLQGQIRATGRLEAGGKLPSVFRRRSTTSHA